MELAAVATIWSMFSCFLLFPRMGLPAVLHQTAMGLLVAELLALMMWSYGSPGAPAAEAGRSAAAIDIPLLALGLLVVGGIWGLRRGSRRKTSVR